MKKFLSKCIEWFGIAGLLVFFVLLPTAPVILIIWVVYKLFFN